ncbi:MAG: hypothetical protein ABJB74_12935 [Gemmatimonas sp.]
MPTFVVGLLLLTVSDLGLTQSRTLSWPEIAVTAHLDGDGRLHVRERQTIRFNGDWNGGERSFAVGFGQRFTFERLTRIDTATNSAVALTRGEIDRVDGYGMFDGYTLRWRSRLPDDPPFNDAIRVYELSFTYGQILEPVGGKSYQLSHDFAFANRDGDIDKLTVLLTLDSAWVAPNDFTGRYEVTALTPGNGFVLNVPLRRQSNVAPASVRVGASTPIREGLLALLVAGMCVAFVRLFNHERKLGRFARVLSPASITPDWLQQELLVYLPEVAGAAWDDVTSHAEVAATLARLVQEGKLASRVETKKILMFSRHVLHLELKADRTKLRSHERALIDKLFTAYSTTTDTDSVRRRFRSSGFDPAKTIRPGIESLVRAMAPDRASAKVSSRFTAALILLAVGLVALGVARDVTDLMVALGTGIASLAGYALARAFARVWRVRITDRLLVGTLGFLVVLMMPYLFGRFVLLNNTYITGPLVLAGLVVFLLALVNSLMNAACTQQSVDRIAVRKRMVAARNFFRAELKKREPQLSDEWYPYMLAFGLGSHVDRWFKAFGASVAATGGGFASVGTSGVSGIAHSSDGASHAFTGFGGGGGFSGGGGGAFFGAAVGGMASSVSPPSSSGSDSGSSSSSGGGSSGGGGGGGW